VSEYNEVSLLRKLKDLEKAVDEMHISINEKEAEVIRLNLCLGDEKKKNADLNQVV
jgi:uncharacterized protein YaaN involved in tellurite resistance